MAQENETIGCVLPDMAGQYVTAITAVSFLELLPWRNTWSKRDSRVR